VTDSLEGKTALVTGAGRGIRRAIALQIAEGGVAVALVARSEDQLAETADRVKELGCTHCGHFRCRSNQVKIKESDSPASDTLGI
jgi:NAD(P)-dependent dehydrogenase (short-subunit alcohol dehydrogenase family)